MLGYLSLFLAFSYIIYHLSPSLPPTWLLKGESLRYFCNSFVSRFLSTQIVLWRDCILKVFGVIPLCKVLLPDWYTFSSFFYFKSLILKYFYIYIIYIYIRNKVYLKILDSISYCSLLFPSSLCNYSKYFALFLHF